MTDPDHGKTQSIRLVDVFALGPFMVWFGMEAEDVPDAARLIMIASGLATIAYNGANYLRLRRLKF
jgi:hypothetical protein